MCMTKGKTTFAHAIKMAESGDKDAGYHKVRGFVRDGRLLGAYGIAQDDWENLTVQAGLRGARWQDSRAQDAVAKAAFDALYSKYGDWRLVAVAWKAGEAVADAVALDPKLLKNEKLRPLADYADQVMNNAKADVEVNQPKAPNGEEITSEAFIPGTESLKPTEGQPRPQEKSDAQVTLAGVLTGMRNRQVKRGAEAEESDSRESTEEVASE